MTGLVLELQRDSLDKSVDVDDLLRKALVISRKLALVEIQTWIELELKGYGPNGKCPPYRAVKGHVKVFNPFHGWQPVLFGDEEMYDAAASRTIGQSVGELVDLLKGDSSTLMMKYSPGPQAALMRAIGSNLEPALFIPRQALVKVLDAVRNQVLEWALDLETKGILGSGLSFSGEEKVAAKQTTYSSITHIGTMVNSQLQQHSSGSQTLTNDVSGEIGSFVEAATKSLPKLGLPQPAREELEAELATLRSQLKSPKPKLDIFRSCLASAKTILEGAAGNVAASALLAQLVPLLPALSG